MLVPREGAEAIGGEEAEKTGETIRRRLCKLIDDSKGTVSCSAGRYLRAIGADETQQ
jgi:hypothetical protein